MRTGNDTPGWMKTVIRDADELPCNRYWRISGKAALLGIELYQCLAVSATVGVLNLGTSSILLHKGKAAQLYPRSLRRRSDSEMCSEGDAWRQGDAG